MLHELQKLLSQGLILQMLRDGCPWNTSLIDYESPTVHRLWRQRGELRIYLHEILPCGKGEPFFHPHPWPSAMILLEGHYEMDIGYGGGIKPPPVATSLIMSPWSTYEMVNPDAWHSVRPVGGPSLSVMVSGKPWDRAMPKHPDQKPGPLPDDVARRLLDEFEALLPK